MKPLDTEACVAAARAIGGRDGGIEAGIHALWAGMAAADAGAELASCPFDAETEAELRAQWFAGYAIAVDAKAARATRARTNGELAV